MLEQEVLAELAALDDESRVVRINELIAAHQAATEQLAQLKRQAAVSLSRRGWQPRQVAELLGVTTARVGQILTRGLPPERALLGKGQIIIAVAGKTEGPRLNPSTMLSIEATTAYHLLAEAAANYGMSVLHQAVPPPGMVNLDRANLIVIGSPRILPPVGPVIARHDPHLRFARDAQGCWYLTHDGQELRSPSDGGQPADYAYIGHLPRPDGKGTFLYLAGIHAMGTKGAAVYLTAHLPDIYTQVKNTASGWSALVRVDYEDGTREIQGTTLATPVYTY